MSEPIFITSLPTQSPSLSPIIAPTTPRPSAKPSISGLVVTLEAASVTSKELASEEISNITSSVVESFSVSSNNVDVEVAYVTTGSLDITVDGETSEEEFVEAVTSSLADLLDIHPKDVTITSVDLDSGKVIYEIASNNYDDVSTIQSIIDSFRIDEVEDMIQDVVPSAQVQNIDVNEEINVKVTIVVDGSNGGNINDARNEVTEILNEEGFEVDTSVTIVTAKPSASPTIMAKEPTTMMPSSRPSITGIVMTLTLSTDEVLDSAAIDILEEELALNYDVNADDITVETAYVITGEIEVEGIPRDVSENEFETILQQSVANALGLHPRDVEIDFDSQTNQASYVILNNDNVNANVIQDLLNSIPFGDNLMEEVTNILPTVIISSIQVDDEIHTELVVTLDATESTNDVEQANEDVMTSLESEGFTVQSESNVLISFSVNIFYT